jgi:hypothetical protein
MEDSVRIELELAEMNSTWRTQGGASASPRHRIHRSAAAASLLALLTVLLPAIALAQPQRTFVASNGSDADPCSLTQPCRAFAAAINAVANGGEVVALDTAGYGTVTINKAVTLTAPGGVYAGITALSGDAVTINAPGAQVTLRNLRINSPGGGNRGVFLQDALALRIYDCEISGMSGAAIEIAAAGYYEIGNSILRSSGTGLNVTAPGRTSIADTRFDNNGAGIIVAGGALVTAKNLRLGNNGNGIFVNAEGNEVSSLTLEGSEISGSATAVQTHTGGASSRVDMTLANNVISYSSGFSAINVGDAVANNGQHSVNLVGNRIVNNAGFGVHIDVPQFDLANGRVILSGNTISRNASGIQCNGGGVVTRDDNTIYDNVSAAPISNCAAGGYVHIGGN